MTKGKHGMGMFTVDEVDAAVQALLSGGVSAADVVGGGLKGALQLAQHGALSAGDAGVIAAKAIDTMHLGALAALTADVPVAGKPALIEEFSLDYEPTPGLRYVTTNVMMAETMAAAKPGVKVLRRLAPKWTEVAS